MACILNIETSTDVCSVALSDGQDVLFEKTSYEGHSHASLLGVYVEEALKEMKKNGRVVLLTATPETIFERVKDSNDRPVLNGRKNVKGISELMEQRREKYEAAADIVINTDDKTVLQICEELVQHLQESEE